jgi:serine/threonine protein kinase
MSESSKSGKSVSPAEREGPEVDTQTSGESTERTDAPDLFPQPTLSAEPAASDADLSLAIPPLSLVGQTIGDFELLAEVGRGGMGVVYKARQESLDRIVALKMLLVEHFSNPVSLTRFLAEARAAASLSHPNIVSVYQVGECTAGPYFVMEYIEGKSVETIVKDRAVPIPWAVGLLIQVTEAVHYAHTRKIVHRDLKPANIMIDEFRRPVVMDFGIAKFVGKTSSVTQHGTVMGTPAYMPPEQAGDDASQVGPHSDVYSLGAILYHLLTGKPPYDDGTPMRTILKVISPEKPAPVRELRPEVPAKLQGICMKCLAKEPADRYPSARELAEELRRFRAAPPTKPRVPASSPRVAMPSVYLVAEETGKQVRIMGKTTVIGRGPECEIILRVADVSKRHCQILLTKDGVILEDLNSANGTRVNAEIVERIRLQDGDELDIAGHLFTIHFQKPDATGAKPK